MARKYSKGVGKVSLQIAIDCHSRYAWARLYPSKLPVTAAHLMKNDVLPTFEANEVKIETVLSDNGRKFCGRPDQHPYELFLQLEGIAHRTARVRRPRSNGILESFHRALLDEYFRVEERRAGFETIDGIQAVLDDHLEGDNTRQPHQGRGMNGRTPIYGFTEGLPKTINTQVARQTETAKLEAELGPLQMRSLSGEYLRCTSLM